jgi:hypothetical protein
VSKRSRYHFFGKKKSAKKTPRYLTTDGEHTWELDDAIGELEALAMGRYPNYRQRQSVNGEETYDDRRRYHPSTERVDMDQEDIEAENLIRNVNDEIINEVDKSRANIWQYKPEEQKDFDRDVAPKMLLIQDGKNRKILTVMWLRKCC